MSKRKGSGSASGDDRRPAKSGGPGLPLLSLTPGGQRVRPEPVVVPPSFANPLDGAPGPFAAGSFAALLHNVQAYGGSHVFWASTAGYGFVEVPPGGPNPRTALWNFVKGQDWARPSSSGSSNAGFFVAPPPFVGQWQLAQFPGAASAYVHQPSPLATPVWLRGPLERATPTLLSVQQNELALTLWCAQTGAAPAVHAAMIVPMTPRPAAQTAKLYTLTTAGTGDGFDLIVDTHTPRAPQAATSAAASLLRRIQTLSEAGVLMVDLRLENTIYTQRTDGTIDMQVIDFDPSMTAVVDLVSPAGARYSGGLPNGTVASARCVELLNVLFLTAQFVHRLAISVLMPALQRDVVEALYQGLRARLGELHDADGANDGLCRTIREGSLTLLVGHMGARSTQWARVLREASAEDTDSFVRIFYNQLFKVALDWDGLVKDGLRWDDSNFRAFGGYSEANNARQRLQAARDENRTEARFVNRMIDYILEDVFSPTLPR